MGIFGSLSGKTKSNRHPIPSCAPAALEALEPRLLLDGSPTPVRLPVSAVQDPLAAIPVGPAGELTVYGETDPWYLMEALLASSPGITVQDVVLRGHIGAGGALSSGVFVNNAEVYGMGAVGIVLSSGNVEDYGSGPNVSTGNTTSYGIAATAQQELLLDPITGGVRNHWDVTELEITFDLAPSKASISFQVVFGSEEYTEYVGSVYVDGFGLFVNGTNIASTGGRPVNINHPDMTGAAGTELDGILAPGGDPVLVFEAQLEQGSTGNVLTFIIADTSDSILDSTVYFSGLTANLVPQVDDLSISTSQDTPVADQVTGSDPQNDPITFAVDENPDDGAVVMLADGSFTYTPDLGFYGSDSFTFIATDGQNDSLPGTVTVVVNDPPTASDLAWNTDEDSEDAAGQTVGNDIQPQTLTYILDQDLVDMDPDPDVIDEQLVDVTHGTLVFNGDGSFTYTPSPDYNGTDSFRFYVNDGYADSNIAEVTITVNPVNDAPSGDGQSVVTEYDGVAVITLTGSDLETADGDLVFTVAQAPAHGSYVQAGSQITYTATAGYSGLDEFQFTVTDTGDPDGGDQGWGFAAPATTAPITVNIGVPVKQAFNADGTFTMNLQGGGTATFTIKGNGTGSAYLPTGVGFPDSSDVTSVVLTGTDAQTVLSISPTGTLSVGGIIVQNGSLKAIDAKSTNLAGNVTILNGSLTKMRMQNASDGILTVGVAPAGGVLSIYLKRVSDFGINSAMPIKKLSAVEWLNDDATPDQISIPWLGRMKITGQRANARRGVTAAAGDFGADLIISGAGLPADRIVLANANIKGAISGSWQITGPSKTVTAKGGMRQATIQLTHAPTSPVPALKKLNVGMMQSSHFTSTGNLINMNIGGMVDSNLFAGVINWVSGDGLPDPATQIDTPVAMGGTGNYATIRKVNIRGARNSGWYTSNFSNSNIAAYNVGTVSLRNGNLTSTGTDFGVSAWTGKRISYTDRDRTKNWTWPAKGKQVLTSDSDFTINLGVYDADSFLAGEQIIRDRAGDAGFAYTDITAVSLRAMSDWVYIAIDTAVYIPNAFADNVTVRVKLDTNSDFLSLLDEDDRRSDYYIDWSLTGDQITLWTGGGHKTPDVWTQISTPTAYTKLTTGGLVIAVPLSDLDDPDPLRPNRNWDYIKVVEVVISKGAQVVDSAM